MHLCPILPVVLPLGVIMSAPGINNLEQLSVEADLRSENEHLEHRIADLERMNQDLERFAFVASHDLREPLRMITTYAQLLAERCSGALDRDATFYVGTIVDGATRMKDLLSDLLAYAELGCAAEAASFIDLDSLVGAVIQDL